ncbi:hypothetical protein DV515_00006629 [Chloebia gouldiae]|uniref:SAM domain-containing protein n=1 Tax=Chloebia gouldiae TaxID=44316 RepID=A0A3L8SK52_CHLGU|nr:hypothetical protein DV515_00006629 [Chloebia gouldiae]
MKSLSKQANLKPWTNLKPQTRLKICSQLHSPVVSCREALVAGNSPWRWWPGTEPGGSAALFDRLAEKNETGKPSNLLLDQSNVDISAFRTTGDWLNGFRTGQCKDIFTGVEYSSCDTIAKISTERRL